MRQANLKVVNLRPSVEGGVHWEEVNVMMMVLVNDIIMVLVMLVNVVVMVLVMMQRWLRVRPACT